MKKFLFVLLLNLYSLAVFSQGDCPGEIVCTNQAADVVVNGALDAELSAFAAGCIGAESPSKSRWYQFCVSTTGTIRFTINPAGGAGNDYDWALWGPNSTCPPTTVPLRCSFAIVSGGSKLTGVNSANNAPQTDLTEGAGGNQWTQDVNVVAGECFVLLVNNYGAGSNTFALTWGGTATLLCSALPIELLDFSGINKDSYNKLIWSTASEVNNDYFILERSVDGENWGVIKQIEGFGNSSDIINYSYEDYDFENTLNYYRLSQTDFNGQSQYFNPIAIDNSEKDLIIIKVINLMGQEVPLDFEGLRIIYYSDGTMKKKVGK